MCGIVGVISGEGTTGWTDRKKFMTQAIEVDTLRGVHSTGIFGVHTKNRHIDYVKRACPGYDFTQLRQVDKMLTDIDHYTFTVGHNRHATKGGINQKNAHPFHHGHIVGVHNGSLHNHHTLDEGYKFDVDSEALFYHMMKNGAEDTIKRVRGAFCLVWYDSEDETLSIIRNSERPMAMGKVRGKNTVLFASEMGMLSWLAGRNGMVLEDMAELQVGYELKFPLENPMEPEVIKRELNTTVVYSGNVNNHYNRRSVPANVGGNNTTKHVGNNIDKKEDKEIPALMQDKTRKARELAAKKAREIRIEENLKRHGFQLGETVRFGLFQWTPYPGRSDGRLGFIEGYGVEDPHPDVIVHCVNKEDAEMMKNAVMESDIAFCNETVLGDPVLILDYRQLRLAPKQWQDLGMPEPEDDDEKEEEPRGKVLTLPIAREGSEGNQTGDESDDFNDNSNDEEYAELEVYRGPRGWVSLQQFESLTSKGCANCSSNLSVADSPYLAWTTDQQPVCSDCQRELRNYGFLDQSVLQ